jgi:hypothetical protein
MTAHAPPAAAFGAVLCVVLLAASCAAHDTRSPAASRRLLAAARGGGGGDPSADGLFTANAATAAAAAGTAMRRLAGQGIAPGQDTDEDDASTTPLELSSYDYLSADRPAASPALRPVDEFEAEVDDEVEVADASSSAVEAGPDDAPVDGRVLPEGGEQGGDGYKARPHTHQGLTLVHV